MRLKGFQELSSIENALDRFFEVLQPKRLGTVEVPLETALNRVVGKSITADADLPSFNRSAVDGYALKAQDTVGASQFQPKGLRLVHGESVEAGELKAIWTGNALPQGADAVAMLEHCSRTDGNVQVLVPLTPGANVSLQGEDVRKGDIVVKEGTRLRPQHLGLLAALGTTQVAVVRRPKVGLLATGGELVSLGQQPGSNEIVETNSILLSGLCEEVGAEAVALGIVRDDKAAIRASIRRGLQAVDMLITTGGTSVGAHDLVPEVIEEMEARSVVVHGVAMRPGMPTGLAVLEKKGVLILSGNPVAAAVAFEVFGRPLIQRLLGPQKRGRPTVEARLLRRVAGALGRRVFLRVKVVEQGSELVAQPVRVKGSGVLTTMTKANGYVVIPEDREGLREGELVRVYLFDVVQGAG